MASTATPPGATRTDRRPAVRMPAQRTPGAGTAPAGPPALRRQAPAPFSAIVLADSALDLTEHLETALREAGAVDIRYASSAADLLRRIPAPRATGIGVICRSPHAEAVVQLVTAMRLHGWRRLIIACQDGDEAAVRLAVASKVRCLVRSSAADDSGPFAPDGVRDLTDRELQVLRAVSDGRTNNEIGHQLGLSGLTVKSHLARIGRKTGTGDRAQMVAMAMRAGLLD